MRLLIISHTEHFLQGGQYYGWGPTVREIDHLASLFEKVVHIAFFYPGNPPPSALPYRATNVSVIPVPASGGDDLTSKMGILFRLPVYLGKISRALNQADVVHVRCPASISMLAIILLAFRKTPHTRWVKYAGNWQPNGRDAFSYRFQRWWLRKGYAHAHVTINGTWPSQPDHIHSFFNPCLTEEERQRAASLARQKLADGGVRIIFAGRVERAKGIDVALEAIAQLRKESISAKLDVLGDGPQREFFADQAARMNLSGAVNFLGWIPHTEMSPLYANAHLILLPSVTEGWPKVLSEAMAHGVVPVASDVSSIGQYLHQFNLGCAVKPIEAREFVKAIQSYVCNPEKWKQESQRSIAAAGHFTYNSYLQAVTSLLELPAV